jgi:nitroreductase
MEFFEVLRKRRSIRKYQERKVEREKVLKLLEAAFMCPSSHNHRPWYFVVVDDRQLLNELSHAKAGAQGLHNATCAIVVCADKNKSDVWIEDAAIAAHTINLSAVALGLGSFWVQIRRRWHDENVSAEEYVRTLLDIPSHYGIVSIIGFGYPKYLKPENKPLIEWDKVRWVHENK